MTRATEAAARRLSPGSQLACNPDTSMYNTGPIDSIESWNLNRKQSLTVSRVDASGQRAGFPRPFAR